MKKSLLALAVLGAYAGVASAQSSVTLYGTVDLNGRYVKTDGLEKRWTMGQDGINSSQLGFRGVEDLGGGLRAGFTLIAGVNPDRGTANTQFWNRRSTVSLFGNWGELRLGRDYTPTFWNQTIFDAFGTNGMGSSTNVRLFYSGTRQDNSIGYHLPSNLGGFYGQVMVSAAENGTTADRPARYVGGRGGFAAGPFDVAASYGQQRLGVDCPLATCTANLNGVTTAGFSNVFIPGGEDLKTWNVGGSWDFAIFKLMGYYNHEEAAAAAPGFGSRDVKEQTFSISGVIPFGQSEVHVGYDMTKLEVGGLADQKVDQLKATYQYNLSKRTAVYTTASWLKNHDSTALILPGASNTAAGTNAGASPGGKSRGIEFGLRHFF